MPWGQLRAAGEECVRVQGSLCRLRTEMKPRGQGNPAEFPKISHVAPPCVPSRHPSTLQAGWLISWAAVSLGGPVEVLACTGLPYFYYIIVSNGLHWFGVGHVFGSRGRWAESRSSPTKHV